MPYPEWHRVTLKLKGRERHEAQSPVRDYDELRTRRQITQNVRRQQQFGKGAVRFGIVVRGKEVEAARGLFLLAAPGHSAARSVGTDPGSERGDETRETVMSNSLDAEWQLALRGHEPDRERVPRLQIEQHVRAVILEALPVIDRFSFEIR
jgi:hypothetical protein